MVEPIYSKTRHMQKTDYPGLNLEDFARDVEHWQGVFGTPHVTFSVEYRGGAFGYKIEAWA
jgi:hypothetical protein